MEANVGWTEEVTEINASGFHPSREIFEFSRGEMFLIVDVFFLSFLLVFL